MKRRKPPIVLGTVLVIMLIAVGIIYAPRGNSEQQPMTTPPPQAEQGDRPKISADQIAAAASSSMKQTGPKAMPAEGGPSKGDPSIAVPKYTPSKQKPNDSSTSSQWYINDK
ncbi:MAG: hypothetical protein IT203_00610 [Fimbriimonadaceae bacterium]|nr:hypothetical protein [Fimbriimonadaceae bacterium]